MVKEYSTSISFDSDQQNYVCPTAAVIHHMQNLLTRVGNTVWTVESRFVGHWSLKTLTAVKFQNIITANVYPNLRDLGLFCCWPSLVKAQMEVTFWVTSYQHQHVKSRHTLPSCVQTTFRFFSCYTWKMNFTLRWFSRVQRNAEQK